MKYKSLYLLIISLFFLLSCLKEKKEEALDYPILNVSLDSISANSLLEFFDRVEIIPLETTKESVVNDISKIDTFENKFIIKDQFQQAIFFFDSVGNFVNKIHRIGEGPGEYLSLSDFYIKSKDRTIHVMSQHGYSHIYDIDKLDFISKVHFYKLEAAQYIEPWSDNEVVLWKTSCFDNSVIIASEETGDTLKGFFDKDNPVFSLYGFPFHKDKDNNVFFTHPFTNEVFQVTKDALITAYAWDFGKDKLDMSVYKLPTSIPALHAESNVFYNIFRDGGLPHLRFSYRRNYHNSKYYYTQLYHIKNNKANYKHVFYDRRTNKSFVFKNSYQDDNYLFDPIFFKEDYLICAMSPLYKQALLPVLSAEDASKLDNLREDDNPIIVKFYFK